MKLTDLHPRWVGAGGAGIFNADMTPAPERHGVGLSFDCPCPACTAQRTGDEDADFRLRHFVAFTNPLDGGEPFDSSPGRPHWTRVGETFEGLTVTPSILSMVEKGGCGWHGWITNGEVTP